VWGCKEREATHWYGPEEEQGDPEGAEERTSSRFGSPVFRFFLSFFLGGEDVRAKTQKESSGERGVRLLLGVDGSAIVLLIREI